MILPLTNGMEAHIDAEDSPLVRGYRWSWENDRGNRTGNGQIITYQGQGKIVLARLILGAQTGQSVSTRDGNPLNCRRSNLFFVEEADAAHRQRAADLRHSGVSFRKVGEAMGISGAQACRLYQTHVAKVLATDPFELRVKREYEPVPVVDGDLSRVDANEMLLVTRRLLSDPAKQFFDLILELGELEAKRRLNFTYWGIRSLKSEIAEACIRSGFITRERADQQRQRSHKQYKDTTSGTLQPIT